jgi:hypothetical protein
MKIVTCITNTNQVGYVHALKASCNYHNLELVTLIIENYTTHRQKTKYLRDYLDSVDPEELIMFTDGYDAILVAGEGEIVEKYNRISPDGKVIMSADRFCGTGSIGPEFFARTQYGYDYICSGGFIGTAAALIDVIDLIYSLLENDNTEINKNLDWSDHYEWTRLYESNKSSLILDSNCEIFQTLTTEVTARNLFKYYQTENKIVENEDLYKRESLRDIIKDALTELEITQDSRIFNKSTKTYPIQIHFVSEINKLIMFMEPFVQLIDKVN